MSEVTTGSLWDRAALRRAMRLDMELGDGSMWGIVRAMQATPHRRHTVLLTWLALRGTPYEELDDYIMQWLVQQEASGELVQTLTGCVVDYKMRPLRPTQVLLYFLLEGYVSMQMPTDVGDWADNWIYGVYADGARLVPPAIWLMDRVLASARQSGDRRSVDGVVQIVDRLLKAISSAYHRDGEVPHPTYHTQVAPQAGAHLFAALWKHHNVSGKVRALDLAALRSLIEFTDVAKS